MFGTPCLKYTRILAYHTKPSPQGNNVNNIVDNFLKKNIAIKKNVIYLHHKTNGNTNLEKNKKMDTEKLINVKGGMKKMIKYKVTIYGILGEKIQKTYESIKEIQKQMKLAFEWIAVKKIEIELIKITENE